MGKTDLPSTDAQVLPEFPESRTLVNPGMTRTTQELKNRPQDRDSTQPNSMCLDGLFGTSGIGGELDTLTEARVNPEQGVAGYEWRVTSG